MKDGSVLSDELAVADAHPAGAKPFARADYIRKFRTLTEGLISEREASRFLDRAQDIGTLDAKYVRELNVQLDAAALVDARTTKKGIF